MASQESFSRDLAFARRILAGSEPDWHAFIERYTPLIRSVLRRYVHDDEDVSDLWAGVLERLHGGRLAQFQGRSTLATWLVLVARSAAFDHLRKQRGRRRPPPALADCSPLQRTVYREIFVRGRGVEEVRHLLRERGLLPAEVSLEEVLADLEERLGEPVLRRIAWDLQADRTGFASGRLLEYLEHAAAEAAAAQAELSPERRLLQAEALQTLARIQSILDRLPDRERTVLELRFRQGMTAGRIAEAAHLRDRREVYTVTERALRLMRKLLGINHLMGLGIFRLLCLVIIGSVAV